MNEYVLAIRSFVQQNFLFGDSVDTLQDDMSFLEAGVIDSTGILELVAWVEEAWGVKVLDDELLPENFDSVARLTDYLTRKRAV